MADFDLSRPAIPEDVEERTKTYLPTIESFRSNTVTTTDLTALLSSFKNRSGGLNSVAKNVGKVRDVYTCDDCIVIVATDRQSAFDRQLASVPFKGSVLNMTSKWWFEETSSLVPNHVIACPHPNVTIGKKCSVFPVEFVMRGYLTGSTSTSIWTNYAKGVRSYCGHTLPEGMVKNQRLEAPLLTPTTKDSVHDELISAEEIVSTGRMTQEDWDLCASYSHSLFEYSQAKALEKGLILVDTKYEFGRAETGEILLIDEIQTPDSSRYWIAASYEGRIASGQEPENIDKEFLRRWYVSQCDPYKDEVLPAAPLELVCELSRRYIMIYEILTGMTFKFPHDAALADIDCCITQFFESF